MQTLLEVKLAQRSVHPLAQGRKAVSEPADLWAVPARFFPWIPIR